VSVLSVPIGRGYSWAFYLYQEAEPGKRGNRADACRLTVGHKNLILISLITLWGCYLTLKVKNVHGVRFVKLQSKAAYLLKVRRFKFFV